MAISGGWLGAATYFVRFVLLIALATWFLRLRGLTWSDVGLRRPRWGRLAIVLPVGLIGIYIAVGVTRLVLLRIGVPPADYSMFAPVTHNLALYLFWVGPVAWGTAAFGEEMLLRGFVLDAFRRLIGGESSRVAALGAVVLQGLLFGALHAYQGIGGIVLTAVIGLGFGLIWLASGRNLWAGIVIHGLIDTFSLTMIFLGLVRA